ncbi:MAG: formylglycine-generating enzyme family protein [Myxococcales bacterium]|nr:formylglycine-generating enzyme family protein [Myxococcales bacterium]
MILVSACGGDESLNDEEEAEYWEQQGRLTEGYWLGLAETEVTQELRHALMSDNPRVEFGSWDEFVQALNNEVPGLEAQLSTEGQWEYAARAGIETPRYGTADEVAWHAYNTIHPAGTKLPNAWGLYDRLGNVREWCQDYHADDSKGRAMPGAYIEDPTGPAEGGSRMVRGGI